MAKCEFINADCPPNCPAYGIREIREDYYRTVYPAIDSSLPKAPTRKDCVGRQNGQIDKSSTQASSDKSS